MYDAYDIKKDELLAEIISYCKPAFWLGGTREIATHYSGYIRTEEECRRIGQWLADGAHERITQNRHNEIIVTGSGTYFVN